MEANPLNFAASIFHLIRIGRKKYSKYVTFSLSCIYCWGSDILGNVWQTRVGPLELNLHESLRNTEWNSS